MKRLLFSAVLLLVIATFFSCSDDPKFNYDYFANPDNVARVANAFEGSYEGRTIQHRLNFPTVYGKLDGPTKRKVAPY